MGGHGHELPYKIPSPEIYKVEDVPQLKYVQEELAKRGLKDPWLRNYVWRYKKNPSRIPSWLRAISTGWKFGLSAFLVTIAVETYFGIDYSGHGHHGDGDDHH